MGAMSVHSFQLLCPASPAGRVGAYGIRPHKWPVRGKFMTSDFRSGAPVPCWYVLGRMQFAPTLTADNGPRHKPASVGNHFAIPHVYPARMAGVPDALIFFCALFLYQDKKRVWGMGGKAPHDNSPRHRPASNENQFTGHRRSGAPGRGYGEGQRFKGAVLYLQDDSEIVFNRSKRKTK